MLNPHQLRITFLVIDSYRPHLVSSLTVFLRPHLESFGKLITPLNRENTTHISNMNLSKFIRFQKPVEGVLGAGTKPAMGHRSMGSRLQIRSFAKVEANTPRQQPTPSGQRRTPVSFDTANLTIRVGLKEHWLIGKVLTRW